MFLKNLFLKTLYIFIHRNIPREFTFYFSSKSKQIHSFRFFVKTVPILGVTNVAAMLIGSHKARIPKQTLLSGWYYVTLEFCFKNLKIQSLIPIRCNVWQNETTFNAAVLKVLKFRKHNTAKTYMNPFLIFLSQICLHFEPPWVPIVGATLFSNHKQRDSNSLPAL